MNINTLLPKHVNYDELIDKAPTYEGSFTELVTLVEEQKVTLITNNSGIVLGIWVDTGSNDAMINEVAGKRFEEVYRNLPVQEWIEVIMTAKSEGKSITDINEETGTCMIGDEEIQFKEVEEDYEGYDGYEDEEELPSEVENVPVNANDSTILQDAKKYLRETYGHYLARGNKIKISVNGDDTYDISNIEWGRKVRPCER